MNTFKSLLARLGAPLIVVLVLAASTQLLGVSAAPASQSFDQPAPQRISFPPGSEQASVQGQLQPGGVDEYVVRARAGQVLTVMLTPPYETVLVIWGADGTVLISDHAGASQWTGPLPATQDYYIDVRSVSDWSTSYQLDLTIPAPTPPVNPPQRITFSPGATSTTVQGDVPALGVARYVLAARAGQMLSVAVSDSLGDVALSIWGADGTVLISDHADTAQWSGQLPSTQDYYLSVRSEVNDPSSFVMWITIPPAPSPADTVTRIVFPPGGTFVNQVGVLPAGGVDRYVLAAGAGQVMSVSVAAPQNAGVLSIWGADGTVLISDHAGTSQWTGRLPSTQDYYIAVSSATGAGFRYVMRVDIPPGY